MSDDAILIKGARQNNLKGLNLKLPLGELIVVTGVSGSGKSSLAFDTVYAEGQRRYVETFSAYARQFLERMDKPQVERIEGIPPAIAIDQTNPVRTSRSTVGTMTELNDHIKLLFARAAGLYCHGCAQPVRRDTPQSVYKDLQRRARDAGIDYVMICFAIEVPDNFSEEEVMALLTRQGYTRIHKHEGTRIEVIQDRLRPEPQNRARLVEALEIGFKHGRGHLSVYPLDAERKPLTPWRYSSALHCADCEIDYQDPVPSLFSFNSAVGACPACRGFGRTVGIDYGLVIPDEDKTLAEGAIKPWQTPSYKECQDDLTRFAKKRGIPLDTPWRGLGQKHKDWVVAGEGAWEDGQWYGTQRFFDWLESKSYKMHIRVLLSKYRSYTPCATCAGARLKPEALDWRLGGKRESRTALAGNAPFRAVSATLDAKRFNALPGLLIHNIMLLPIERCQTFFENLQLPKPLDEATDLLLGEIRTRLRYLVDVGLGYLSLDRQSRTLSGGEVQRINLTTALGTSLVNTLFVLDEPSIGLHPRDMQRVVGILHRLRDAGNSLLVVEHDPQVMLAADRILDIGPGPGERGGKQVFFGTPKDLMRAQRSLTADYLRGSKQVFEAGNTSAPDAKTQWLELLGAGEHNLKDIDIALPLRRLVCLTGVSGSGKSTLLLDILYRALCKQLGKSTETPGRHAGLRGHQTIEEVVLVDQSPIGKTTRSNPASYVGAWNPIRTRFAAEPLARERGYTPGTFSFNSGTGRCPVCTGSGFEHVEMQFLSDVYLRCPECNGKRYREEILEVKLLPERRGKGAVRGHSIADILEMTVTEALAFFAGADDIARALEPLSAVGLSYLKLGQPVPTLSGGEAQRLKLAGHLAKAGAKKKDTFAHTLFLFDEPTTGLHFDDIAKLLHAFTRLLEEGHSLVVIEHNLDVIRAADWIVDLGPEGGDAGGTLVCTGTPAEVARHKSSHTGGALRDYEKALKAQAHQAKALYAPPKSKGAKKRRNKHIEIVHAREHNLRNINVRIPRERFTVITGISGSGKSTVAFDILFNEGQRRYLESLNAYARQFVQPASRPDVDAIFGISPTVAIEQRTSRGGHKSTVATLTEVYHFLRLLYVKLGTQYCPDCDIPIDEQSPEAIAAQILRQYRDKTVRLLAPLVVARKGLYNDLAKWAHNKGFAQLRVDGTLVPTDDWPKLDRFKEHDIELPVGELTVTARDEKRLRALLDETLEFGKGVVQIAIVPKRKGTATQDTVYSTLRACPACGISFEALDPRLFSYNSRHGWCTHCFGTGLELKEIDEESAVEDIDYSEARDAAPQTCTHCHGQRLRPEALAVRFAKHSIADIAAMNVEQAKKTFTALKLKGREAGIARDILTELRSRLAFLNDVGLSYLNLDRAAPTLSGGEAQRIRLAAQLGSNLRGVCYILDEPTIGLHPRDNDMLLKTLKRLEGKGNTIVVVEHDEDTIRRAEHVIDIGPGAGVKGGEIVVEGSVEKLMRSRKSLTGRYLAKPLQHPLFERRPVQTRGRNKSPMLNLTGIALHNLKKLRAAFPINRLVCVTGVSGSGKSTLVRQVLHENLRALTAKKGKRKTPALHCASIEGAEHYARVLEVDQTPIGKTPRSCPATYVGVWDEVRRLFAETPEARIRGYGPSRFSFNVKGGRCEACEGQGQRKVEMNFLPDVKVACEVCNGARFNADTLAISYKEKNIAEVLAMSIDEAVDYFSAHHRIHHALQLLQDVGLGYLSLGQQSPTLSGGEAQRIKLVTELAKAGNARVGVLEAKTRKTPRKQQTLYILDEPTVGLHMADVEKLLRVLHRLVEAGHSVIVIEHNLDVIADADWIIDMGPEGGNGGGRIVAQGTPEALLEKTTHTAKALKDFLKARA